jgi:hypothetical protein
MERSIPKGPRDEKRSADVIGNAVKVARIATGEEQDEREASGNAAAQLGKLGGAARALPPPDAWNSERRGPVRKT